MRAKYSRNTPILDKLISRYKTNNTCWEWTAGTDRCGYGRIWYDNKNQTAHKVAYSVFVGPIPEGLHVLHSCDNPKCINPDHLSLGTHADNMKHKSIRGRINGDKNPMSQAKRNMRKMLA